MKTTTRKFELLVFDWDGTLMDSGMHIVSCIEAALHDAGLYAPARDDIRNIIGLGLQEAIQALVPHAGEALRERITRRYRAHFFSSEREAPALFEGVPEMLRQLRRQDYLLAVATGKGRQGLNHVLAHSGLREVFHATRTVDEARSKPHPQMLRDVMDTLGVAPGATLMIGDTDYDLLMAHSAGTHALAVCGGAHERERLLQCRPLACLEHVTELARWLHPVDYATAL
jgi:phosphoglycolate phosphatase